jgi:hypothetical protein
MLTTASPIPFFLLPTPAPLYKNTVKSLIQLPFLLDLAMRMKQGILDQGFCKSLILRNNLKLAGLYASALRIAK